VEKTKRQKPKTKTKHLIAGKHIFKWLSTWPSRGGESVVGQSEAWQYSGCNYRLLFAICHKRINLNAWRCMPL